MRLRMFALTVDGLAGRAVLAVGADIPGQMGVQFCSQRSFGKLLDQRGQNTILAGQRLTGLKRF